MIERRTLLRWWYGVLVAVLLFALLGQLTKNVIDDRSVVNFFSYFTIQSNILVLVTSVLIVRDPSLATPAMRLLRLAALTGITVTGLVFAIVIAPELHLTGIDLVFTYLLHYVSPPMMVIGFFLIGPRIRFEWRDMWFMLWPLAYVIYTMIRGLVSTPNFQQGNGPRLQYPYSFLDLDAHSWGAVLLAIALVALLLMALASLYIWSSHRLARAASQAPAAA
jgi:hypothetical protein